VEGMLHAAMLGVAESYLGAFAVELGHRDGALAMLATLPLLVGSSAQLLASPLVSLLGSRKRLVVLGAAAQALTHIAFTVIAWSDCRSFAVLLAEFALSGRWRALSRGVGMDLTMRFHQAMALGALALLAAHPFLYLDYVQRPGPAAAVAARLTPAATASGAAAWMLLVMLVFFALFRAQLPWRYEAWRLAHGLVARVESTGRLRRRREPRPGQRSGQQDEQHRGQELHAEETYPGHGTRRDIELA